MLEAIKARIHIRDLFEVMGIKCKVKTASCPLHHDTRPSMSFNDKGLWYCFVCGVGGDIVRLVMLVENLGFKESLHWLNNKFSLGLTDEIPKKDPYLEALNENYTLLKESLEQESEDYRKRHFKLSKKKQHLWHADDFTFEELYEEKMDFIQQKLRELENARYKLRRNSSQKSSNHS